LKILKKKFYRQDAVTVAEQLVGNVLVREREGQIFLNRIIETEAYFGEDDTACHASKGRTQRTEVMYQAGGVAYIYLIYGMYHMLNIVTGSRDHPQAVLIRALEPLQSNLQLTAAIPKTTLSTKIPKSRLKTNGPGKLCRYLAIDKAFNGWDVTIKDKLWLTDRESEEFDISSGPRIGIDYAHPEDRDKAWRFWLKGSPYVSRR